LTGCEKKTAFWYRIEDAFWKKISDEYKEIMKKIKAGKLDRYWKEFDMKIVS
jgi:hypothetical protein